MHRFLMLVALVAACTPQVTVMPIGMTRLAPLPDTAEVTILAIQEPTCPFHEVATAGHVRDLSPAAA